MTTSWYSAEVRVVSLHEGDFPGYYMDMVYVVRDGDDQDAIAAAVAGARRYEKVFDNPYGDRVRLAVKEVLTLDRLPWDDLDRRIVHEEEVVYEDEDQFDFEAVFDPFEYDIEQKLAPQEPRGDEEDEVWYSAQLTMARLIEGQGLDTCRHVLVLFRHEHYEYAGARKVADELGRSLERDEVDEQGRRARWRLRYIDSVDNVNRALLDGAEVYSRFDDVEEGENWPFDHDFRPELSEPEPSLADSPFLSPRPHRW